MVKTLIFKNSAWFRTKATEILLGLVFLILAFMLFLRAFYTGSWWEYGGTLVSMIIALKNLKNGVWLGKR